MNHVHFWQHPNIIFPQYEKKKILTITGINIRYLKNSRKLKKCMKVHLSNQIIKQKNVIVWNKNAFHCRLVYIYLKININIDSVHACSIKINIKARNQRHTYFLSSHIKPKKNQHPTTYQIFFFTFQMNLWL